MLDPIRTNRRCSFCDKAEWSVDFLFDGGRGLFVCSACVNEAAQVIAERRLADPSPSAEAVALGKAKLRFAHQALRQHFAPLQLEELVTSTRLFPARMRADLQRALDHLFDGRQDTAFFGIHTRYGFETTSFASLMDDARDPAQIAPPRYEEVDIGEDEPMRCLETGLWLFADGDERCAVVLASAMQHGQRTGSQVEVAVRPGEAGKLITARIFETLERYLRDARSYRGKVLSLESELAFTGKSTGIRVHRLEAVTADQIILPRATVDLLKRNVIGFAAQRPALAALDLPQKKGLLFYGPPGTGKTHSVRYLAAELKDHTVLLMTAEQVGLIPEYMALARLLQPSILVIEDADLIARQRDDMGSACEEVMLNRLLNEMDGLADDAQIFFVLTTNRPQAIEAAVSGRPGRIDQAIEFPLPDRDGRCRLAALYGRATPIDDELIGQIADRTANVSAAFIKELMRRAAQFYLERQGNGVLRVDDVDGALNEMLFAGGRLNVALLGGDTGADRQ